MESYTHRAKIYGFECYFNENTGEVQGTNWFNEKMIDVFIWIDVNISSNEMFKIEIIEKL
jgi:hypothetical protein